MFTVSRKDSAFYEAGYILLLRHVALLLSDRLVLKYPIIQGWENHYGSDWARIPLPRRSKYQALH